MMSRATEFECGCPNVDDDVHCSSHGYTKNIIYHLLWVQSDGVERFSRNPLGGTSSNKCKSLIILGNAH